MHYFRGPIPFRRSNVLQYILETHTHTIIVDNYDEHSYEIVHDSYIVVPYFYVLYTYNCICTYRHTHIHCTYVGQNLGQDVVVLD